MVKILLDLDGTLSEPRQIASDRMIKALKNILQMGYEIGIITGSGFDYIREQIKLEHPNLRLYPCNGTQMWIYDEEHQSYIQETNHELDEHRKGIIYTALQDIYSQMCVKYPQQFKNIDREVFQIRPNMINFCPIGRTTDTTLRNNFVEFDKQTNFRKQWLPIIRESVGDEFDVVLGGQTSFDIYPRGWDKSFVLSYIGEENYDDDGILFIGNSFQLNGNDAPMLGQYGVICFEVDNPEETLDILEKIR